MQQPPNPYSQFQQPYNAPTSPYAPSPLNRGRKPRNKKSLFAIGCGSFIGIVLLLALCSAIASSFGKTASVTTTDTPTPTPTATAVDLSKFIATETPVFASTTTPTPKPAVKPTPQPTPKPTQPTCQAINNNPWCYNFSPGSLIYNPPSAFCSYFACVSTFWTATSGYVAECANGDYTHSGGVRGACSRDGGVLKPLYSH